MTRKNPFAELEQLFERMSEQMEGGDWSALSRTRVPIDLVDTGDEFVLIADLPGYDREGIDVTLSGDTVRVNATREPVEEDPDTRYIKRERGRGSASRSIQLPDAVDEAETSAAYADGVLRVELSKSDPTEEGRRIDID